MTQSLLLYLSAVLAVSLFPGPDMLFIINQSLKYGRKYGVSAALGICAGCFVHILGVSLGLSTLLIKSHMIFTIIKYLGAGYLFYIGLTSIISKNTITFQEQTGQSMVSWKKIFFQGFLTNVLNPKVALFFLAFLPQFVSTSQPIPISIQFLTLGLIFNGLGTCVNLTVALCFGLAKNWLISFPRIFKLQQKITGAILIGLGVRLAS